MDMATITTQVTLVFGGICLALVFPMTKMQTEFAEWRWGDTWSRCVQLDDETFEPFLLKGEFFASPLTCIVCGVEDQKYCA